MKLSDPLRNQTPRWLRLSARLGRLLRLHSRPAILVVRLDSLGDALLFTGALRWMRRRYPGHEIVLVTSGRALPIMTRCPHVDRLITIDAARIAETGWLAQWRRLAWGIRIFRRRYETVVHAIYSTEWMAHLVCAWADADRKLWFTGDCSSAEETLAFDAAAIYSDVLTVPVERHELDKTAALLQRMAGSAEPLRGDILPDVYSAEQDRRAVAEFDPGARTRSRIALCAGARFAYKDWGTTRFADLLIRLADLRGPLDVYALGSAEDQAAFEEIAARLRANDGINFVNVAGRLSVFGSIEMIRASDLCLGNDTFGLHAAVAVETPSLVIMGGGDFGRWAPWGPEANHRMAHHRMDCYGCKWHCIYARVECLERITVDDVVAALPVKASGSGA
jgi:heptosyltransferase-2